MRVLVTGGAGFIGRALVRDLLQSSDTNVDRVTIFSRDETKQDEMQRRFPSASCSYVLGDVCDTTSLRLAMAGHDAVIHAAAVKYVDRAERDVAETVRVNVDGSRSVLEAARLAGVEIVIGLSTDKAVEPINLYGMTKACMERLFVAAQGPIQTRVIRYGNVIGSTGSVIPLFLRQRSDTGRISITDPSMTRFWLTADQAVETIWTGLTWDREWAPVIVPLAHSLSMADLAELLECPHEVIGVRPGEKQHETLLARNESVRTHGRPPAPSVAVMPATTHPVPYEEQWSYHSNDPAALGESAFRQVVAIEIERLIEDGEL